MTRLLGTLTLFFLAAACRGDETLTAYGAAGKTWHLVSIDGTEYGATASLAFPEPGKIVGSGPCNSFTAMQDAPYPWISVGPIAATRRACPDLSAEARFFSALTAMSLAEVAGGTLLLSDDAGREMTFTAQIPGG